MNLFKLLPIYISSLILGAHFLYSNNLLLVALSLLFPAILLFPTPWAARITQVALTLGALEWVRTMLFYIAERKLQGEDWLRLAFILSIVALLTCLSGLVFRFKSIKKIYKLN